MFSLLTLLDILLADGLREIACNGGCGTAKWLTEVPCLGGSFALVPKRLTAVFALLVSFFGGVFIFVGFGLDEVLKRLSDVLMSFVGSCLIGSGFLFSVTSLLFGVEAGF